MEWRWNEQGGSWLRQRAVRYGWIAWSGVDEREGNSVAGQRLQLDSGLRAGRQAGKQVWFTVTETMIWQ